jgi:iron(III) transport system substrate-binding protein
MRHHRLLVSAAGAAAVLLLAACGASPTASSAGSGSGEGNDAAQRAASKAQEVYDRINGMTGEARHKTLVELAEKEGKLSIYTSNTDMQALVDGFENEYDIDVSVYRANS